jgi:hypothetical protein
MPFLVRAATGLPLQAPTYWIVSKRRPSGSQPNTLHNDLRALMCLYLWADARGVDLQDRFESGALLTLTEVADLDTFCGRHIEEVIAELLGHAGVVIRLEVRNSKARHRAVNLVEKRNRLAAIHSFIEYTSADHLSRLHLRPDRWNHYDSVRDNCLQWIRSRCEAINKPSRNDLGAREGLAEAEVIRLRAVIEPDHASIRKLSLHVEHGVLVPQMARGKELGSCGFQFRQQQADPRAQHRVCHPVQEMSAGMDLASTALRVLQPTESAKAVITARYAMPVLFRMAPAAGPPRSADNRPIVATE